MKLLTDWRQIFRRAWSMRLMAFAAVLSGVEVVLPFFSDMFPRNMFAGLSFLAVAGALVARLVAQRDLK